MVHQMDSFWMCGSVWSVLAWARLSSSGWTRHLSPSPTGVQTNQSNQLRNPAVSSILERYVCQCVYECMHFCVTPPVISSLFVLGLCGEWVCTAQALFLSSIDLGGYTMKLVWPSQAVFALAGFTKPKSSIRDNGHHNSGYQLHQALCTFS